MWRKKKAETRTQRKESDANWCVIVMKPRPEHKEEIADKISDAFSLSHDFADELLRRSPVILLDNLAGPVAAKAKEYFQQAGAEMAVTNERSVKRKCYRVEWQDEPPLSFLDGPPDDFFFKDARAAQEDFPFTADEKPEPEEEETVFKTEEASADEESELKQIKKQFAQTLRESEMIPPAPSPVPAYETEIRHLGEKLALVTVELAEVKAGAVLASEELKSLAKTKDILEKSLNESQNALEGVRKAARQLEAENAELHRMLEETREARRRALADLEESRAKAAALSVEMRSLNEAKAGIDRALRESEGELDRTRKVKAVLEAEKEKLNQFLAEAREHARRFEADCRQAWDFFERKADTLKTQIDAAKNEAVEVRKKSISLIP